MSETVKETVVISKDLKVPEKAKKARKPYVWTAKRTEAFNRMRSIREAKCIKKQETIAENKDKTTKEKFVLAELIKNTRKIKQILALIGETPDEPEKEEDIVYKPSPKRPPPKPVVSPIPEELKKKTEKPKVVYEKPEDSEEEEEEEPQVPPPPPVKIKQPINTFRYSTNNQHTGLPRPPILIPTPVRTETKKTNYLFL